MRKSVFVFLALTAACGTGPNPIVGPIRAVEAGLQNITSNPLRGQVEVYVKSNHPALIADIERGGGPALNEVYDIAQVPAGIRSEHTLRLQSDLAIYRTNLDALIAAILLAST